MTTPGETGPSARGQRPVYQAVLERIVDHAPEVRSWFLTLKATARPRFIPGMFISITIPLAGETRVRPYTIASDPEAPGPFEICFNRVANGAGSAWLFARQTGDTIDFTGPFGTFTLERAPAAETVFIAEGTAIAPIRPMIRRALASAAAPPLHLLYGADRAEHLLYRAELEDLARDYPNLHVTTLIEPRGRDALYATLLAEAARCWVNGDTERQRHFFICGVGKGVLQLRDLFRGAGYERRAVHYEQW